MAVTIYDIAKEVGTSAATVSMALQGNDRISKNTRGKIYNVAKKMGYRPNYLARGLVKGKTKTIGFVFNFSSVELAHDFAYAELFHYISQAVSTCGYKTFFHGSTTAKPVKEVLEEVMAWGGEGAILGSSFNNKDDRQAIYESRIPTVIISRDIYAKKVSCVLSDDNDGARQVVNHLFSLGHNRRIAFVGKNSNEAVMRRFDGYCHALALAGLQVDEQLVIESSLDMEDGKLAAQRIAKMKNRPTAVFACVDLLAIGIIAGLRELGIDVPNDISVAGFDNLTISRLFYPSLTTIDKSCSKYAEIVVSTLMGLIKGQDYGERVVVPVSLVTRQSTAPVKSK
jgi:LacI family transcriptional regulator